MLIRQSFDMRFVEKLKELETKYGVQMFELEGIGPSKLDINQFARDYFKSKVVSDISIDGNANVDDDSVINFEFEFTKSLQKLNAYYLLWKKAVENEKYGIKRANKLLELCINGSLKIHDLHMFMRPYCYAFSLFPLVSYGLPFVNKIKIGPPKHFSSFVNLIIQFVAYASNQIAGACALPDLFVYMDWYARKDFGENYLDDPKFVDQIKQDIQSLVYSFGYPYRGNQSAFTNVSVFDQYFLKHHFKDTIYPDLSKPNLESIQKLQKFYVNWFITESKKQVFTFPVNTAVFYKKDGIILDKEFLDFISEANCFNGCFNIYCGDISTIASCCRLLSDTSKTKEYMNSFGGGGSIQIGSHRVVTLNLPRLAYESEDDQIFLKKLEYTTIAAQDILDIHRDIISDIINRKKLPLYTYNFMFLKKQFSTIGFIGINECCELQQKNILSDEGKEFSKKILDIINELNEQKTQTDNHIRNIEQIPGESAAAMFAKKDKLLFSNAKYDLYGNQYIPLWYNVDVIERIKVHGVFDNRAQGGAILHINVTDSLEKEQMRKLIEFAANSGVIYFAVNMNIAKCNTCGQIFIGKFAESPCHKAAMTNFLRVVGFLTPVASWTPERREEYKTRQFYKELNV